MSLSYNFSPGTNNGSVLDIVNNLDSARTQHFTYDNLNRVATARTESPSSQHCFGETFGYDEWANLLSIERITPTYNGCTQDNLDVGVDVNNQINNPGFAYDPAGNLIDDGNGPGTHTYQYDAENRLVSVDGGATASYIYDGDGQRVQKSGSSDRLYWYGLNGEVLQETLPDGTLLHEYIYFSGERIARRDADGTVYYFFSDHLGSARIVADAAGTVVEESDFYAFGGEIVITDMLDNNYKFTGLEREAETRQDHTLFRQYAFILGRWTTTDPLGGVVSNPQTLNRYAYVLNGPVNLFDPFGLSDDCTFELDSDGNYVLTCKAPRAPPACWPYCSPRFQSEELCRIAPASPECQERDEFTDVDWWREFARHAITDFSSSCFALFIRATGENLASPLPSSVGEPAGAFYGARQFTQALRYAATTPSRTFGTSHLVYPLRSSVFRGALSRAASAPAVGVLVTLDIAMSQALYAEGKAAAAGECH